MSSSPLLKEDGIPGGSPTFGSNYNNVLDDINPIREKEKELDFINSNAGFSIFPIGVILTSFIIFYVFEIIADDMKEKGIKIEDTYFREIITIFFLYTGIEIGVTVSSYYNEPSGKLTNKQGKILFYMNLIRALSFLFIAGIPGTDIGYVPSIYKDKGVGKIDDLFVNYFLKPLIIILTVSNTLFLRFKLGQAIN